MELITYQLALGFLLLLVAFIAIGLNIFNKRIKTNLQSTRTHPLSLIITIRDEAELLESNLPLWLNQDYDNDYEVIVVAEKGRNETDNAIKRIGEHPKLYVTFVPQSSKYICRKKLAITLGVKAAQNEWIVLTEPSIMPTSEGTLKAFASYCNGATSCVMGFTIFEPEAPMFWQYEHTLTALSAGNYANNHQGHRASAPLIAFRKSQFLEGNGYGEYQQYLCGEYDFIAAKYGSETRFAFTPSAWCIEATPSLSKWTSDHVGYQETRRHLRGKAAYRWRFYTEQLCLHGTVITSLAGLVCGLVFSFPTFVGLSAISLVALAAMFVFRTLHTHRCLKSLDIVIKWWKIPFYDLSMMWVLWKWKMKHSDMNASEFTSHKG